MNLVFNIFLPVLFAIISFCILLSTDINIEIGEFYFSFSDVKIYNQGILTHVPSQNPQVIESQYLVTLE